MLRGQPCLTDLLTGKVSLKMLFMSIVLSISVYKVFIHFTKMSPNPSAERTLNINSIGTKSKALYQSKIRTARFKLLSFPNG